DAAAAAAAAAAIAVGFSVAADIGRRGDGAAVAAAVVVLGAKAALGERALGGDRAGDDEDAKRRDLEGATAAAAVRWRRSAAWASGTAAAAALEGLEEGREALHAGQADEG